jgi:hypothetical protein
MGLRDWLEVEAARSETGRPHDAHGLDPEWVTAADRVRTLDMDELMARADTLEKEITEAEAVTGTELERGGGLGEWASDDARAELDAIYDRMHDIEVEEAGGWANYVDRQDRWQEAADAGWRAADTATGQEPMTLPPGIAREVGPDEYRTVERDPERQSDPAPQPAAEPPAYDGGYDLWAESADYDDDRRADHRMDMEM